MQTYVVSILYISIIILFLECYTVFKNMKSKLHQYLFFCCVAMLVNNIGYLLGIQSTSLESRVLAVKFSYAGRVWIAYTLFMFAIELCQVNFPRIAREVLLFMHASIYISVLTVGKHCLYYTWVESVYENGILVLKHGCGIFYHILMFMQMLYIIFGFYMLFSTYRILKNPITKKCFRTVTLAILSLSIFYIIQITHILPISRVFDLSVIGNIVLVILLYVAIVRCNLLSLIEMAKDYIIDGLTEGIIAVDTEGKVKYYNKLALKIFPEIIEPNADLPSALTEAITSDNEYTFDNRIYVIEKNVLHNDYCVVGDIYVLVDATDLKEKEYKLKADAQLYQLTAKTMKERLLLAEEFVKQDRKLRHDRRHFEALLMTLLQDGNVDEAKKYLSEQLAEEPGTIKRYCDNTTINVALMFYVNVAEKNNISVETNISIPATISMDDLHLGIVMANLLENAINACKNVPEDKRFIHIKAVYKEQLLLEIENSCVSKVPLNEKGYPFSNEVGHGIGTQSVLSFVEETGGFIQYESNDNSFKVRMILN